jgi:hypothetical protein
MQGIRSASSRSLIWPWRFVGFAAVHRHHLRSPPQSISPLWLNLLCPGLAVAPALLLGACWWVSAVSPVGWHSCNPGVSPGVVLCLAAWPWARCCSAVVVAHWMVALRRHNRGCTDGVAALVCFQLLCELTYEFSPIFSVSKLLVLVAWPVSQACLPTTTMPFLVMWWDSRIPMLASTCCCC